ncbi:MAG TPA: DUF5667 domain-containing protein [Patescibacteria group bacterium]|nr:DUF5667 domain-containing protein [Patescibacteria group bacterium]
MKKLLFIIFFFSIFLFNFQIAFAQEEKMATAPAKVESYELPYPGLLPDHPLYFLKMFRDRIIGFFISDPVKKAEFDILQADKRLNGSVYLLYKNTSKADELAISTISKGQNYFDDALGKIKLAKKQGINISDITTKLKSSLKGHKLTLKNLESKVSKKTKDQLSSSQERLEKLEKEATLVNP